jgi:hypothetical protein
MASGRGAPSSRGRGRGGLRRSPYADMDQRPLPRPRKAVRRMRRA